MAKHLLRMTDWTAEEVLDTITAAIALKDKQHRGEPHHLLAGKTLAMLFEKSSTRTRVSFEAGMVQLGGHAIMLSPRDTQIGRGEPIKDTARVLSRYVDAIMIRTFAQETADELAKWSSVPVVNGLTDLVHPCQVLADLMTAAERGKDLRTMKVAWIGDGNNMAHSWMLAAGLLGFTLTLACPAGYAPDAAITAALPTEARVSLVHNPKEAAVDADVVTTDVWASMGQEEEQAQRAKAFAGYCVDGAVMAKAKSDAIFLHCLPAHRGEEVTEEVLEGPNSAVWDEAENRLHIQKAILVKLVTANS